MTVENRAKTNKTRARTARARMGQVPIKKIASSCDTLSFFNASKLTFNYKMFPQFYLSKKVHTKYYGININRSQIQRKQ